MTAGITSSTSSTPSPIAVAPSVGEGNYQCASGCATHRADGTPMLFYGHTPLPRPDGTRPPRQQWAALPLGPDLRTWRTLEIGLAPGRSGVPADIAGCWTDMFVFREVGRFDPERLAFEMDGPAGIVDYSYGLTPPPDPADPNYSMDASGVPVCRYGAPSPVHTDSRGFSRLTQMDASVNTPSPNWRWATTRVAIPPSPALHLEVAATGGPATLRVMTVWPIKPSAEICP